MLKHIPSRYTISKTKFSLENVSCYHAQFQLQAEYNYYHP